MSCREETKVISGFECPAMVPLRSQNPDDHEPGIKGHQMFIFISLSQGLSVQRVK